jgi:hypothetical protein
MRKLFAAAAAALLCLTSCETIRHHFAPLAENWEAKIGQLQYRGPKTSLIGEVLVRFSRQGDFELTFTKGPGVALLVIHQDATFARVQGPLARGSWSGPTDRAPARLRGWLALRSLLTQAQKPIVKYSAGAETFVFAF